MKKIVELPIIEPIYQTYQYQGSGAATIKNNPTIRNWYLNEAVNLTCSRRFLTQTALLDVTIVYSEYQHNPYLEKKFYSMQFLNGYINPLIRNLLNDGYYVYFTGVDDFYVQGKSLYQKHHMLHDGLICGYNQNDKTYCIYSYDINWVYRKFWTSQKSFNEGRIAMQKQGKYGIICAIKPKPDIVNFSIKRAYEKIKEYLNSSLEVYPFEEDKNPYGIAVQLYIVEYLDRLIEGSIPYKNMDRRVFRLIWEHKKAMLERIEAIEETLKTEIGTSDKYKNIVKAADNMRMLYASHRIKKKDALLPLIKNQLLQLIEDEKTILTEFVKSVGDEIKE